jgi:hypothetical protein
MMQKKQYIPPKQAAKCPRGTPSPVKHASGDKFDVKHASGDTFGVKHASGDTFGSEI